jgi:hypothetical protein
MQRLYVCFCALQYLMLLEQFLFDGDMTLRELAGDLPPLHVLIRDYHVAPGVAWGLWRPIFRALEPALAAQLVVSGPQAVVALLP